MPILAREHGRGAGHRNNEIRGCASGVNGLDVVDDRLVRGANKSYWAHDDLNDVYGFPDALVQRYAKVAGEFINNQVPAVQRLQHQDLFHRGLSVARRGGDRQQSRQQGTRQTR